MKRKTDGYPADYTVPDDSEFPIKWTQFEAVLPHPRRGISLDESMPNVPPSVSTKSLLVKNFAWFVAFVILAILLLNWLVLALSLAFYLHGVYGIYNDYVKSVNDGLLDPPDLPVLDRLFGSPRYRELSGVAYYDPHTYEVDDSTEVEKEGSEDASDFVLPWLA